ncbi:MAG: hypothetical protein ABIN37_16800 [Burkholderiaceae bacterium]
MATCLMFIPVAALVPPPASADDAPQAQLRDYPYTATGGRRKSINPDAIRPPVGSPSQNLVAPQKSTDRASAIPDPQNAIQRMLRARELSFAPAQRLDHDPRAANYGMDLSAIKLRMSRDSVVLRAHFSFN